MLLTHFIKTLIKTDFKGNPIALFSLCVCVYSVSPVLKEAEVLWMKFLHLFDMGITYTLYSWPQLSSLIGQLVLWLVHSSCVPLLPTATAL